MAYSQLMRYQLYEQNIHVCIFIQAEMIITFSFIKSVLLLKERQNEQHIEVILTCIFVWWFYCIKTYGKDQLKVTLMGRLHSVESPSMVDPQWNIWYWGSKWNLHTVCWSVVGCEWGTTFVYLGITYVCFIPSRLPVFAVEPQYLLQYFLFLPKVSFELHIQNRQKISCWFKIWMGFVGPILIKLWTSSIWGFL